jgi:hypothetical protein
VHSYHQYSRFNLSKFCIYQLYELPDTGERTTHQETARVFELLARLRTNSDVYLIFFIFIKKLKMTISTRHLLLFFYALKAPSSTGQFSRNISTEPSPTNIIPSIRSTINSTNSTPNLSLMDNNNNSKLRRTHTIISFISINY